VTASPLSERLAQAIADTGPISVAKFMAAANTHYYATRDPLGAAGDFVTAPEISQIFGELAGLWLADQWLRAGRPPAHYVELGPGRGTLAVDALRAMATVGCVPQVHLVETSPVLRACQAERLPQAQWHSDVGSLPTDAPLMIVANEFFDALPIQQMIRTERSWCQRMVDRQDGRFVVSVGRAVPLEVIPETLRESPIHSIIETCPDAVDVMRQLAQRIGEQSGAFLIIDYGYEGPVVGETLQSVERHAYANPFDHPGERDLTAHVDFLTLSAMAELCGVAVHGPVDQGLWLGRLGLHERAAALSLAEPARENELNDAARRLSAPEEMGRLFQVMAIASGGWPQPAGFA
jgi:NADH dehydrogenase [ubiquinone] 1 alpha subcomplex assembly factor 7